MLRDIAAGRIRGRERPNPCGALNPRNGPPCGRAAGHASDHHGGRDYWPQATQAA